MMSSFCRQFRMMKRSKSILVDGSRPSRICGSSLSRNKAKRTGHGFSRIDTDLFFVFKFLIRENSRESVAAFCLASKIKNCFGSAWVPVNLTVLKCAEYRDQQWF